MKIRLACLLSSVDENSSLFKGFSAFKVHQPDTVHAKKLFIFHDLKAANINIELNAMSNAKILDVGDAINQLIENQS